jgi:hypothetical protein
MLGLIIGGAGPWSVVQTSRIFALVLNIVGLIIQLASIAFMIYLTMTAKSTVLAATPMLGIVLVIASGRKLGLYQGIGKKS